MNEIAVGIVGAGNIVVDSHLPSYQKLSGVKVAAICDIDFEKAKCVAQKFGIEHYYSSMEEMIKNESLDAVDICTWNCTHVPLSIAAAKAGLHVICEKPAGISVAELKELKTVIEQYNTIYLVAVPNRFKSETAYIRSLADKGFFGDIVYAKTSYMRRRGEPIGWFSDKSLSGGGPIMDIGVHAIDGAWYLLGCPKPLRVSATLSYAIGETQVRGQKQYIASPSPNNIHDCEDLGAGVIDFENGAQLFFEASWTANLPDHRETYITGTKAGAKLTPPILYTEQDGFLATEEIKMDTVSPFVGELEHFYDCIRKGERKTRYDINDAITMQSILDAIYRSDELKRQVTVDKEGNIK